MTHLRIKLSALNYSSKALMAQESKLWKFTRLPWSPFTLQDFIDLWFHISPILTLMALLCGYLKKGKERKNLSFIQLYSNFWGMFKLKMFLQTCLSFQKFWNQYPHYYLLSTSVHYIYNLPDETVIYFFWSKVPGMKMEKAGEILKIINLGEGCIDRQWTRRETEY